MSSKKAKFIDLAVSITFALVIILFSSLLKNTHYHEHLKTAIFIIIAIWFVPFSYLSRYTNKKCEAKFK